jgi:hypothetical protein
MKVTTYYCDICGTEMGHTNAEEGFRGKRISTSMVNQRAEEVRLDLSVIITGWSNKIDICYKCGDEALQKAKRKLAFEIVGEK